MSSSSSMSKLKFRIITCTGEDPQYPVTELLTISSQTKGWQSQRFCEFPQEIVFQFLSPVKLKHIQILSHQFKITKKVDVYAYMPDFNYSLAYSNVKFQKIGFLTLDSNERSNFQARELKSIYLDCPCLYIKFSCMHNSQNKFNLFNQV